MAKAIYEKRQFVNRAQGGEIIEYEFYGIQGTDSNGELNELRLQNLNSAEKIAFKMLAAMDNPTDTSGMEVGYSKGGEVDVERKESGSFLDD